MYYIEQNINGKWKPILGTFTTKYLAMYWLEIEINMGFLSGKENYRIRKNKSTNKKISGNMN